MSIWKKILEIAKNSLVLFAMLIIFYFIKSEMWITIAMLALILISFKIRYEKGEWKIIVFGLILGFLFEIAGDAVYKLQNWNHNLLFGIPLWLPLMWGYGFVLIRRIGNVIVGK